MASVLVLITGRNVVEYHTHPVCKGAVAPERRRQGGTKKPHQKYMTNDHKSEFDIVF